MEQKFEDVKITYEKVSENQGHARYENILVVDAANNIFSDVKEKAMQVAVKGEFLEFDSVDELQEKLVSAAQEGFSIRVYDEVIGG